MFVQVITAKLVDADGLQRQVDRWQSEIRPLATGFVSSTNGVTDDGRLVVLARFESEEAAQRHSESQEQAAWWAETEKTLDDVTFQNSADVTTMGRGPSADAGFVQVMRGRVVDAAKIADLRSRMAEFEAAMTSFRPDVLGDETVIHTDGTFTNAVYFTSETDARANEAKEAPPEMQAMFGDWMTAAPVDEFLDLKNPRTL